jgi:signal transduction histidine kinase
MIGAAGRHLFLTGSPLKPIDIESMLYEFLTANREELIGRCRAKVIDRASPKSTVNEVDHGVPFFLDQLIKTLTIEQGEQPLESRRVSGPAGGGNHGLSELGETATQHGGELMRRGFTVEQVVHDYGDLCQSITDLAFELNEPVEVDEFRTLNRCLDNGIALAVTEFNYQRDFVKAHEQKKELNEQIGFLAHELRNYLNTATLALFAITDGNLGITGATGTVLNRSLVGMRTLIDRTLTEVRMESGLTMCNKIFSLADFIAELKLSASLEAQLKKISLVVSAVDLRLALDGDRDLLLAAVGNLLQNAFKFAHSGTEVILNAYSQGDRIFIDVEDHGEGMAPGDAEKLFQPFSQVGSDKSGMGLGLTIARRSVDANGGILTVRNKAGAGCVFTIDLPRHSMPVPLA